MPPLKKELDTVIAGSTERKVVDRAIDGYANGLKDFLTTNKPLQDYLGINTKQAEILHTATSKQVETAAEYTKEVILELNKRYEELASARYTNLKKKDFDLWNNTDYDIQEGVMLCVDQGLVTALYPPDSVMGRSLAGNTRKQYIGSINQFVMDATFMKKVLIHEQRQNALDGRIEWIVVHTGCGRVGQMLSNTHNPSNFIPNFDQYFRHADALAPEFTGDRAEVLSKLETLKIYWETHRPNTGTQPITDEGRLAAVLQKVAKRQALRREIIKVPTKMPIQLVDKRDLNVFTGLDHIDIITDPSVLKAGGFTDQILEKLVQEGRIFSLRSYSAEIYTLLEKSSLKKGSRTYKQLQTDWVAVSEDLVEVTEILWKLYTAKDSISQPVKNAAEHFIRSLGKTNQMPVTKEIMNVMQRRLIHDLFHVVAYTYLLNTFEKGNDPGRHMETHLETGNPDEGALPHLGLGQGEIAGVNALNVLTEYAVLGHSIPGQTGAPVPALLRMDTDRPSHERMSFEETIYAQNVLHESLKLWPYMFGDIIPFVVVRGKLEGGISRVPLSVLKTFDNLGICFERGNLPVFAPAANSQGEVVLVPSRDIVQTRVAALKKGGGLKEFRQNLSQVADSYSSTSVQRAFQREYKQDDK
jgi:hypothetical protein